MRGWDIWCIYVHIDIDPILFGMLKHSGYEFMHVNAIYGFQELGSSRSYLDSEKPKYDRWDLPILAGMLRHVNNFSCLLWGFEVCVSSISMVTLTIFHLLEYDLLMEMHVNTLFCLRPKTGFELLSRILLCMQINPQKLAVSTKGYMVRSYPRQCFIDYDKHANRYDAVRHFVITR